MKNYFLLLMLIPLIAFSQTKRALQPSDFYRYQSISDPQVSPEGNWVAYVLSSVDTTKDRRTSDIWMVSWDGQESIQLTNSQGSETSPRWSPDGKYLSFLSSRKSADEKVEEGAQLWLMNRKGGEAKRVTNIKGEVEDYSWSADGSKIVFTIKEKDLSDTAKTKTKNPYVIDRYHFKQDYVGYLDRRTSHLYLLTIGSEKLDSLTTGLYNESSPVWSPDGTRIAFVSNHTADPDKNDNTDIFVIEAKHGGKLTQLTKWTGSDNDPQWSPDGKLISYLQSSSNENFTMYGQPILSVVSSSGGEPILLSEKIDRPIINPRWGNDSRTIYALEENDRQSNIVTFSVNDHIKKDVLKGDRDVLRLDYNKALNQIVALISEPQIPVELYAIESGQMRRLTHVQDSFLAPLRLAKVEGFTSTSKDGTKVSGLLYTPVDGPQKNLPLILFIHGGPVAQDAYSFDMDRQMYAAAGFAVAAVNYRGSNGRGLAYTRAIFGDWGHKEVMDIVGAADYLISKGIADESRMGIAGWSYGGISTNYTIATDPRFKAAVSGAGSSLQLSMYGVDQYITQYENELGAPWKNQDKWIALSYPFFHADKIKTPTLFMASQNDFNVPVAGAEQMYQALKSLGVPTTLVIYPGQNHGVAIPSYIKDRYERHIKWFNKYLNNKEF